MTSEEQFHVGFIYVPLTTPRATRPVCLATRRGAAAGAVFLVLLGPVGGAAGRAAELGLVLLQELLGLLPLQTFGAAAAAAA